MDVPASPQQTVVAAAAAAVADDLAALRGRVVCIDGGIGAGKSTLGRALARLCAAAGVDAHFERERRHEALLDMYVREPARYGFAFQLAMVADAINRLHTCEVLAKRGCAALLERGPLGNRVFGRLNRALGNISADEYAFYERLLPAAINGGTDLTVYLHVSHDVALRRIGVRADPAEAGYGNSYLWRLADAYFEAMLDEAATGTRILAVPWDAECALLCELGAAAPVGGSALTASRDPNGPAARPLSAPIAAVARQAAAALAAPRSGQVRHAICAADNDAAAVDAALAAKDAAAVAAETRDLVQRYCGTYAAPRRTLALEPSWDVLTAPEPACSVNIDWGLLRASALFDAEARWFHEELKYAIVCALWEGNAICVHNRHAS